jgi:ankyrin repeat protein
MLKHNRDALLDDQAFKHRFSEIKLSEHLRNLHAHKQPLYIFEQQTDALYSETFFQALLAHPHIKELKFRSALIPGQLRALRALVEDSPTLLKILLPGQTLPHPQVNLAADLQVISDCLLLNVKMLALDLSTQFESAAEELQMADPRQLLFADVCQLLIQHPSVRKLLITTALNPAQLRGLQKILLENIRITSITINRKDALAWHAESGAGLEVPSSMYSSKKSPLQQALHNMVMSILFNASLAEVVAGRKDVLSIPLTLSPVQQAAALNCLQHSNRVRVLELYDLNETVLKEIPPQGSLQELRIKCKLDDKQYGPLKKLLQTNTSLVTTLHQGYSDKMEESFLDTYHPDANVIRDELIANRFLVQLATDETARTLRLEKFRMSDTKLPLLLRRLATFTCLEHIEIDALGISEAGLFEVVTCLVKNRFTTLRHLLIRAIPLSQRVYAMILNLIQAQPALTILQLQGADLVDRDIDPLAQWLRTNPALSVLNLYGNKLGNQGINILCEALETNRRVSSVYLGGNRFDSTAIPAITRLLSQTSFITTLSLASSCMLENDVKSFVAEISKSNSSVCDLDISHHTVKNSYRKGGYNGELITTAYKQDILNRIEKFKTQNTQKRDKFFTHVRRGEIPEIIKLFGSKVSPLCTDSNGDSALHVALSQTSINMALLECLIQRGAHPLLMNKNGRAPVDLLTADSPSDLCQLLQSPQDYFAAHRVAVAAQPVAKKHKALSEAPKGNLIMDKFLGGSKRPAAAAAEVSVADAPPLKKNAVAAGDASPAKNSVVASPVESTALVPSSPSQFSAVANTVNTAYFATLNSDLSLLGRCLALIDPSQRYPDGNTLWHLAASVNALECLHLLYKAKQVAQVTNFSLQLPLHLACLNSDMACSVELVELLIAANPQAINALDIYGQTPLFCLTGGFHLVANRPLSDRTRAEAVKLLLSHHADPNAVVEDFNTQRKNCSVLQKAVSRGLRSVVKVLIASPQCNLSHVDALGWSVLHYAVHYGEVEILARLFIQPQLNLDLTNQDGKTARQMLRENQFSRSVRNPQTVKEQMAAMFEARSRQRLFSLASDVHWVKSLAIRYGSRLDRNQDQFLSFNEEHAVLQNAVRPQMANSGNLLSASLTFIVSKGTHVAGADLPRVAIKVNITFTPKFHATNAWQGAAAIEKSDSASAFKTFKCSPDALERIISRFDAAPADIRNLAVDNVNQETRPLSKAAIQSLFNSTAVSGDDYDFEKHFHHSEPALFDHLQQPEVIEHILTALQADAQFVVGCKVKAVVLNAFSKNYLCQDCMLATMGFQNTEEGAFFKLLKTRLSQIGCTLPRLSDLRAITLFSAQQPYKQARRTADDHDDVVLDLRAYPNNKILSQDIGANPSTATLFTSRK